MNLVELLHILRELLGAKHDQLNQSLLQHIQGCLAQWQFRRLPQERTTHVQSQQALAGNNARLPIAGQPNAMPTFNDDLPHTILLGRCLTGNIAEQRRIFQTVSFLCLLALKKQLSQDLLQVLLTHEEYTLINDTEALNRYGYENTLANATLIDTLCLLVARDRVLHEPYFQMLNQFGQENFVARILLIPAAVLICALEGQQSYEEGFQILIQNGEIVNSLTLVLTELAPLLPHAEQTLALRTFLDHFQRRHAQFIQDVQRLQREALSPPINAAEVARERERQAELERIQRAEEARRIKLAEQEAAQRALLAAQEAIARAELAAQAAKLQAERLEEEKRRVRAENERLRLAQVAAEQERERRAELRRQEELLRKQREEAEQQRIVQLIAEQERHRQAERLAAMRGPAEIKNLPEVKFQNAPKGEEKSVFHSRAKTIAATPLKQPSEDQVIRSSKNLDAAVKRTRNALKALVKTACDTDTATTGALELLDMAVSGERQAWIMLLYTLNVNYYDSEQKELRPIYEIAKAKLTMLAQQGDIDAMLQIALWLGQRANLIIEKNVASQPHDPDAISVLTKLYSEALYWYQRAATAGNDQACLSTAALHLSNPLNFVSESRLFTTAKAVECLTMAADRGCLTAKLQLLRIQFNDNNALYSDKLLIYRNLAWQCLKAKESQSDFDNEYQRLLIRDYLKKHLEEILDIEQQKGTSWPHAYTDHLSYFDNTVRIPEQSLTEAMTHWHEFTAHNLRSVHNLDRALHQHLFEKMMKHDFDPANADVVAITSHRQVQSMGESSALRFANLICDVLEMGTSQVYVSAAASPLTHPVVLRRLNMRLLDISSAVKHLRTYGDNPAFKRIQARLIRFINMLFCTPTTFNAICEHNSLHESILSTAINNTLAWLLENKQRAQWDIIVHIALQSFKQQFHAYDSSQGSKPAEFEALSWFAVHLLKCAESILAAQDIQLDASSPLIALMRYRDSGFIRPQDDVVIDDSVYIHVSHLYLVMLEKLTRSTIRTKDTIALQEHLEAVIINFIKILSKNVKRLVDLKLFCIDLATTLSSFQPIDQFVWRANTLAIAEAAGIGNFLKLTHMMKALSSYVDKSVGTETAVLVARMIDFIRNKFKQYLVLPDDYQPTDPDLERVLAFYIECFAILQHNGSARELLEKCDALSRKVQGLTSNLSTTLFGVFKADTEEAKLRTLFKSEPLVLDGINKIIAHKRAMISDQDKVSIQYNKLITGASIAWKELFELLDTCQAAQDTFKADVATQRMLWALPEKVLQTCMDSVKKFKSPAVGQLLFILCHHELTEIRHSLKASAAVSASPAMKDLKLLQQSQLVTLIVIYKASQQMQVGDFERRDMRKVLLDALLANDGENVLCASNLEHANNLNLRGHLVHYAIYQQLAQYDIVDAAAPIKALHNELQALLFSDDLKQFMYTEVTRDLPSADTINTFYDLVQTCLKSSHADLTQLVTKAKTMPSQPWTVTLFATNENSQLKFLRDHPQLLSALETLVAPPAVKSYSDYDEL